MYQVIAPKALAFWLKWTIIMNGKESVHTFKSNSSSILTLVLKRRQNFWFITLSLDLPNGRFRPLIFISLKWTDSTPLSSNSMILIPLTISPDELVIFKRPWSNSFLLWKIFLTCSSLTSVTRTSGDCTKGLSWDPTRSRIFAEKWPNFVMTCEGCSSTINVDETICRKSNVTFSFKSVILEIRGLVLLISNRSLIIIQDIDLVQLENFVIPVNISQFDQGSLNLIYGLGQHFVIRLDLFQISDNISG